MSDIEKSHGGERGKKEMNVEGEIDREWSDVRHPRGPRFPEEREGIGGEKERKSLTGCKPMEVDIQTVSVEENIEGGEASEKMELQDGTRKKSVSLVAWGEGAMGTTTVHVRKVGKGRGIVVMGG